MPTPTKRRVISPTQDSKRDYPLENIKIISDIASIWFGLIGAVLAAGFATNQYLEKEQSDRVHETLEALNRFNRQPYLDARSTLEKKWLARQTETLASLNHEPGAKPFKDYVRLVVSEEKLQPDIFKIIEFYDGLEICISHKLCDAEVAMSLFQPDAITFFNLHYAFILDERKLREDIELAGRLQNFTQRHSHK